MSPTHSISLLQTVPSFPSVFFVFVVSPLYHLLLHLSGSLRPMTVSFPSPKYSSSSTSFSPHTIHLHFTPSHYISSTLIHQTPYSSILTPHNFLSLHQTPASSASHHSSSKLKLYSLPGSLQHNLLPSHQTHSLLGWTTHTSVFVSLRHQATCCGSTS